MISAKIICDSVNPNNQRLVTYVLTYPRFIHSELMTHRTFSRNAASSRAIPIQKMIRAVWNEPAMPVSWGVNGKGMQAKGELTGWRRTACIWSWLLGCRLACIVSWLLSRMGAHKQIANRVTEPWAHMTTIVTASELPNFFNLRAHKDAQPEFQALAFAMLRAYADSIPKRLAWGEWHLPFADRYLGEGLSIDELLKISTARCARVSYLTFDNEIDHSKDYCLHDNLESSRHMSPFEHPAVASEISSNVGYLHPSFGNFAGYMQYRKTLRGENQTEFNPEELLKGAPSYA